MPMNDVLREELPDIPVQLDDKKLKEKHKKVAAEFSAFKAKVSAAAKAIEKDVKALDGSFDELVVMYMKALDAKYGKDADKINPVYAVKLGKLQKLVGDFDLGV